MNKVVRRTVNDIDNAIFETPVREGMQYVKNSNRARHSVSASIWPATSGTSGCSKVEWNGLGVRIGAGSRSS